MDYSEAKDEEIFLWFRAELIARIIRALISDLPVKFLENEWQAGSGRDLFEIVQEIEDAIVGSGRLVTIDSDDKNGVVIGVRGYEM